ncbi:MAG: signal peptidase I [Clostridiales bacterium]|nr:signal peptidase I [Clostridiales bacterium]
MARNDKRNTVRRIRKEKIELVKAFSISLAVALAITTFVRPTLVKGQSMEPTLEENDYLIVKSESLIGTPPKFGDLVVFNSKVVSKEGHSKLLKRVVGLPGDTIEIKDGTVYRNGIALKEEYIKEGITPGAVEKFTVAENSVFVMGDNRAHSLDSRNKDLGTIDYEDIIGTVKFRLFPLNKIGTVK